MAALSTVGRLDDSGVVLDTEARCRLTCHLAARRSQCGDCFCRHHCAGGCYVRYRAMDGGQPSAYCAINRGITAQLLLWYGMDGGGVWRGRSTTLMERELLAVF